MTITEQFESAGDETREGVRQAEEVTDESGARRHQYEPQRQRQVVQQRGVRPLAALLQQSAEPPLVHLSGKVEARHFKLPAVNIARVTVTQPTVKTFVGIRALGSNYSYGNETVNWVIVPR